jgi:hypothetical protein
VIASGMEKRVSAGNERLEELLARLISEAGS